MHGDLFVLLDLLVEDAFHVAVSSEGFFDMTATVLNRSDEFNGTEPIDIHGIEEHESHGAGPTMNLEGIPDEGDPLQD